MVARFILAAFILGAVTGFMSDIYTSNNSSPYGIDYTLFYSIGGLAATAIIGLTVIVRHSFAIENLYKTALLLCIIGYAVIPALGLNSLWPFVIVGIGYTLIEILVWIMLTDLANRFQYTSVQVFGIGRALILAVSTLAGFTMISVMRVVGILGIQTLVLISAAAVSLIAITLSFILPDRVLESFEGVSHTDADNQDIRFDAQSGTGAIPDSTNNKAPRLPLQARCHMIGEYHHLSPREIEVFHLLACGRNAPRIQEELLISAGTANTHLRNIYRKLEVHTQQELIDLMQTADLDVVAGELEKRKRLK
jgi:DNA-binding CsgD family transcriptional regulator